MKFTTSAITAVAATASLASAAPTTQSFKLQAHLQSGMPGFANQYIVPAHLDATTNNVLFTKDVNSASVFTLTNGTVTTVLGNAPASLIINYGVDVQAEWASTNLNIGSGNDRTHFSFDSNNNLVYADSTTTFNGWRACNWVHDAPELFRDLGTPPNVLETPTSCAKIALKPVYV